MHFLFAFILLVFSTEVVAHAQNIDETRQAAEQGNDEAQYRLGAMHDLGQDVPEDDTEAVKWYLRAAEQGNDMAQLNLGHMYAFGEGTHMDINEAVKWIRLSAEQGNTRAQFSQELISLNNHDLNQDIIDLAKLYRVVAEQGNGWAQYHLGRMYRYGWAVEKNLQEATKWWHMAAEQENDWAQYSLGYIYANGEGVPQNYQEAVNWWRMAAAQGNDSAYGYLGWAYANGQGVRKNEKTAVKWWRMAADLGNHSAQYNLGWAYANGQGVRKNEKTAVRWWRMAAEEGNAEAQVSLGGAYAFGSGVPKNYQAAIKWFRMAADQGNDRGQAALGVAYAAGTGVPENYTEAYAWANLSASQGNTSAMELKNRLRQYLSPYQIAEAQRRSSEISSQEEPETGEYSALRSSGSGILVNIGGYILTNYHVIAECKEIIIGPSSNLARLIAQDKINDLALLLLENTAGFQATVEWRTKPLSIGANVVAVGFPLQNILSGITVTQGQVSAAAGIEGDSRYVQITNPIQPGNSGGPLLDMTGRLVGIVTSTLNPLAVVQATGNIPQNVNFAIRTHVATQFLNLHKVSYNAVSEEIQEYPTEVIADQAKAFTVQISCSI